ncbi:hypothetical protein ACIQC7_35080 [Kitasatospora sp. NPDC088556]
MKLGDIRIVLEKNHDAASDLFDGDGSVHDYALALKRYNDAGGR